MNKIKFHIVLSALEKTNSTLNQWTLCM